MKRPTSAISPVKGRNKPIRDFTTPTKKRPDKRLRFSGTLLHDGTTSQNTTGLTPGLRNTSFDTPISTSKSSLPRSTDVETIQFTPFRQTLDRRSKSRLLRNGLSAEINDYESDKKFIQSLLRQIRDKDEELQQLKDEPKDIRSAPTVVQQIEKTKQDRMAEVESELESLRQSFIEADIEPIDWDYINVGDGPRLGSDGGDTIPIYEDEETLAEKATQEDRADAALVGLELESARQAKQSLFDSTRSHSTVALSFEDSPAPRKTLQATMPPTPNTLYNDVQKQLRTVTNRAEEAETAMQALNTEIIALGFSDGTVSPIDGLVKIAGHFRQMRLDLERTIPGETAVGFDNVALMPEIIKKLKQLVQQTRDREAELKSMRDQQRSLTGNFEHAIIAAEKATARVKELEEVIDNNAEEMLEARMRAQKLEKDLQEKESNVKSLVSALNKYREDVTRLEELIVQIEAEQKSNLEQTRIDISAEFEQQLSDLDAKATAEQTGRRAAEESAVSRQTKIQDLENALKSARKQSSDLQKKLLDMEGQITTSSCDHEQEFGSLNSRIANLATALTSANAEVSKVKIINTKLEERYRNEVEQGALAIERIQSELIRSVTKTNEDRKSYLRSAKVRLGNWEIESDDLTSDDISAPMTPASIVRFVDVEAEANYGDDHIQGTVETSRGKKHKNRSPAPPALVIRDKGRHSRRRRQYDSGIGMTSSSDVEFDEDEASHNQGVLTPDLSSDPDLENDIEMST